MSGQTAQPGRTRRRVKWEPWAAMILVLALGLYLVWSPVSGLKGPRAAPGSRQVDLRMGNTRGIVEITPGDPGPRVRVLLRDGYASPSITPEEFDRMYGPGAFEGVTKRPDNSVFRILNITSWGALVWVSVGFVGQILFAGRTLVQWLVSEKRRESVVPELFWWLSLTGGVMLFTYFVWRQDFVGVLGQSSGVVIYARNLRLIHKQRRRAATESNAGAISASE
jgi:lipid-A-disaccharide synthase-like uncharacterized protein